MAAAAASSQRSRNSVAAIRPAPLHWRIKLYELEDQGAWIDKGTGFVHCKVVGELGGPALVIRSEENDGVIFFQSKVQPDDVYEIQGDNIIMWREPEAREGAGVDYALSFQESSGCSAIWEEIGTFQNQFKLQERAAAAARAEGSGEHVFAMPEAPGVGHGPGLGEGAVVQGSGSGGRGLGIGPILSILELSRSPTSSSRGSSVATSQGYGAGGQLLVLPPERDIPEEGCLARIRYKLENLYPAQREFAVCQLLDKDGSYMHKMFRLFAGLEAAQDLDSLRLLADIFRAILLLNSPELLEHLIGSDKTFRSLCGVMEYDRTLRERGAYRDFMFKQSRFQEVVPLDCLGSAAEVAQLRSGCTVLFRLRFVRDIVLHPKIDDPGITAVGSMISFSSTEICMQMLQSTEYMVRVLKVIWPALYIDNYLPAEPAAAPSGSQTVSPCYGPQPAPASPTREEEGMMEVVGPALPSVVRASAAGSSSPVVTPPLGSPAQPGSPMNSSAEPSPPSSPTMADSCASPPASASGPSAVGAGARADRPIDGVRFLRELFAMSKFLTVEKRVEHFHSLFERLHQPLFLVLNRVLVDCRGGPAPVSVSTAAPEGGEQGDAASTATPSPSPTPLLFLPEERGEAAQVVGEVLTALCIVCSSLLRRVVLGNPVPAANPITGQVLGAQAPAAVPTASAATPAPALGALARQASGSSHEGTKRSVTSHLSSNTGGAPSAPPSNSAWWEHNTLFLLIDGLVNSPDSFAIQSFGDVLKLVLDLEKAPSASVKNDNYRFLTCFYDHYLSYLIVPFLDALDLACPVPAAFYGNLGIQPHCACSSQGDGQVQPSCAVQASRRLIFEALVQCVTAHSYRFKYYAMRNGVLAKLLGKTFQAPNPQQGQAWLHLLGLKLAKAVLGVKDEFYYKHIEKQDLLRNMLLMFREIAHRDNLVTACFLDVVEDIRQLGVKSLVLYLVDKYAFCFEKVRYQTAVFERLKVKYEQIKDRSLDPATAGSGGQGGGGDASRYLTGPRGRQQRTFSDFDEEDYFFSNDDDASSQSSQGSGAGAGAGGEDQHRDKRYKGALMAAGVGANTSAALASILHGAFAGEPPQSSMTAQNVGNHLLHRSALASGAASNMVSTGAGGRSLQRTNSLGKGGGNSNNSIGLPQAGADSSSEGSAGSRSTTAGLRKSLVDMLGAYGIEDGDGADDGMEEGEGEGQGAGLTHRNVAQVAGRAVLGTGVGAVTSIYDDEDAADGVSELSDCMSLEGEGEGCASPAAEGRRRARTGSQDSTGSDPFAGTDFVRGSAEGEGEGEGELQALALPPLKSRFGYDDEEEGNAFLSALSAGHSQVQAVHSSAAVSPASSTSSSTENPPIPQPLSKHETVEEGGGLAATGNKAGAGHISFSLKKKPKL